MKNWKILSLDDKSEWSSMCKKMPPILQDIYYTSENYQLYEDYGDGKARCFVFEKDGDIALYPFLINSVNELGYNLNNQYYDIQGAYGYNGIVSSTYKSSFIENFYFSFNEFCRNNRIVAEFTRFHPVLNNYNFSTNNMLIIEDRKTVLLDLTQTEEQIWENSYSSTNRNMIRKAIKNNIVVNISDDINYYHEFLHIYTQTMKNVGALNYYYFQKEYFEYFKNSLGDKQKLLVAIYKNNIIGGLLLMINGQYAHYHLSGRLPEFPNIGSNNLLLDFAIKYARNNGCKYFHFGGGTSNSEDDSLLKFKSNFSKTFPIFRIGKKIHNHEIYYEVIHQWEKNYSTLADKYKNILLRYHFIS